MNAKFFEWPWFFTKEKKRDKAPSCCQFQDCGKKLTFDNNYRCLCCGLILCVACKKSVTFGLPESKEEVDFFCFRCAEYVKKIDKQEKEKSSNYGLHSAFNNEKFTNILQSYPIKKEIVRDSSHGTSNFLDPLRLSFGVFRHCFLNGQNLPLLLTLNAAPLPARFLPLVVIR